MSPDQAAMTNGIGLYFFSADDGGAGGRYDTLLAAARAGDVGGLDFVWLPERHFQPFGGDHPNPSVLAAAIATATARVRIRAGSVVLPLHHPLRVAEEWAVVDNLSGGRVELSAASGWHPADFVLEPHTFEDRASVTEQRRRTVDALWRGQTVAFADPTGRVREISTFPRPVQPAVPWWITAAGNPATFEHAGVVGAGVLTGFGAFTASQLAERIQLYRRAFAANHEGRGRVSVMIHAALGDSGDEVRAAAVDPLRAYLATYTRQHEGDDPDRVARSLDFAVQRYLRSAALIGSVDEARARIKEIFAADIDEVSCLVDFGVSAQTVLDTVTHLCELRAELLPPAQGTAP